MPISYGSAYDACSRICVAGDNRGFVYFGETMTTMLDRVKSVYRECGLLVGLPYVFSGGHNPQFLPSLAYARGIGAPGAGYDCSSADSVGLRAGGLLFNPRPALPLSTIDFLEHWGEDGPGEWMTLHIIQTALEEHMAIEFNIPTSIANSFYSEHWFQAANPRLGIGWIPLSPEEIAIATQKHWSGT